VCRANISRRGVANGNNQTSKNKSSLSSIYLLLAAHGFTVVDRRCDMKSLAVAVTLTTIFALPVYAGTVHPRHTAMPTNHEQGHPAAIRNRGVYLLENGAAGSAKQVPNFQDNFAIDY
jgi:hypothetical protein